MFTNTSVIQAPALYGNATYDPFRDLTPITQLGTVAIAFAIRTESPIRDIGDYLRTVKAEPGKHAYSSYGVGSSAHLLMEGLKDRYGLDLTHVAYKGEGPAMQDVLANQIEGGFFSERLAAAQQKAGSVRALAVTGALRSTILPETPTFAEAGIAGMETVGWYGVLASGRTSPVIAKRLSRDINQAMQRPEIQARMQELVIRPTGTTPEEFGRLMKAEDKIWKGLITKFGIKAE